MKMKLAKIVPALLGISMLSSCIFYQGVQMFVREDYPGQRPAMVIKDVNGKPASQNWKSTPHDMLPPASHINTSKVDKASDGLPYSMTTEFSNVLISPYYPHHHLDYKGFSPGDKVWDPYTRKPFYIKRTYTFN